MAGRGVKSNIRIQSVARKDMKERNKTECKEEIELSEGECGRRRSTKYGVTKRAAAP
jgi:hypothetical protein